MANPELTLNAVQTVVEEITWGNVDEVLFFCSLEMKITCILAENSLHMHNYEGKTTEHGGAKWP